MHSETSQAKVNGANHCKFSPFAQNHENRLGEHRETGYKFRRAIGKG
jgi:hypothetical protein